MPTLLLENVPPDLLAQVERAAANRNVPVSDEALRLLRDGLRQGRNSCARPVRDEEEAPSDAGPCNFPRPLDGPVYEAVYGGERLPPERPILDPTPE